MKPERNKLLNEDKDLTPVWCTFNWRKTWNWPGCLTYAQWISKSRLNKYYNAPRFWSETLVTTPRVEDVLASSKIQDGSCSTIKFQNRLFPITRVNNMREFPFINPLLFIAGCWFFCWVGLQSTHNDNHILFIKQKKSL
jgi:hypothetical protein